MALPAQDMTELKIRLRTEAGQRLKERAAASGKDAADYAAELIEDAVTKPTLGEILAPAQEQFARSGMTEDELSDFLEEAKHRRRAERRKAGGG